MQPCANDGSCRVVAGSCAEQHPAAVPALSCPHPVPPPQLCTPIPDPLVPPSRSHHFYLVPQVKPTKSPFQIPAHCTPQCHHFHPMPKPSSCPQHHRPHPIPSHPHVPTPVPVSPPPTQFPCSLSQTSTPHFHHVTHSPAPRSHPGPTSFTSEPNTSAPIPYRSPPATPPHLCSRRPTGRASQTAARPSGAAPSSGRRRCTPTAARTPAARPANTLRAAQLRPAGQRPLTPPGTPVARPRPPLTVSHGGTGGLSARPRPRAHCACARALPPTRHRKLRGGQPSADGGGEEDGSGCKEQAASIERLSNVFSPPRCWSRWSSGWSWA